MILHIGMPKAGSTALQHGLSAIRERLRDVGVLYPKSPVTKYKHGFLMSGTDQIPRLVLQKYKGDVAKFDRDAAKWLEKLAEQAKSAEINTIVLSNEHLFNVSTDGGLSTISENLQKLGADIEVVVYVRRPSDYYLSMSQQTLKASYEIEPIQPISYRDAIEGYAKYVSGTVHVLPYDRTQWPGGDVLRHFLDTFLPDADVSSDGLVKQRNSSMSAEAMSIVARYRATFWSNANNRFTRDTGRLVRAMAAVEAESGGPLRPRLHDHVRWHIDHASTDLLWLRDAHGVAFDGVDYERVGKTESEPTAEVVEDICEVDAERRERLLFCALHQLAVK